MEATGPVEESISAELVLVDPELARRARSGLPDPPWLLSVLAERQEEAAPPTGLSQERSPRPTPRVPKRQRSVPSRIGATLAGGSALLVLVVLLASAADLLSRSDELSFSTTSGPNATARQPNQSSVAGHARADRKARRERQVKRPAPKDATPTKGVRQTHPRSAPTTKPTTKTRVIPVTQRVFSWHRHAAAAYYQLYLQRGFTTVYQARTVKLRLTLPARLKLRPGTYKVRVRLAIATDAGIVPGPTIVAKTIRI